jgi:hypothetical protein
LSIDPEIAPDIEVRAPKIKTGPATAANPDQRAAGAIRSILIQSLP